MSESDLAQSTEEVRGSFLVAGVPLGPSPLSHPGFQHHAHSQQVDLQREEYVYPEAYQPWLPLLALVIAISFVGFWLLNFVPEMEFQWVNVLTEWSRRAIFWTGMGAAAIFALAHVWHFCRHGRSGAQPLSKTELRHLVGRTACTFWSLLLFLVGLSLRVAHAEPEMGAEEAVLYVYNSLAAFLVMYPAWWLVNRNVEAPTAERTPGARSKEPVKAGLLMSIFWSGAIFAAELAKIANSLLAAFWAHLDPTCHMEHPMGPAWPLEQPSKACILKAWAQWVLTPGLVEETLKFAVLLRLVPSLKDATESCWLTACPRMSVFPFMPCCGWVLKLAKSPAVVLLSGMASGAGFSTAENSVYLHRLRGHPDAALIGIGRVFAAVLHVSLTGISSFFLALSMHFQVPWVRYLGLLLAILTHGTFDASLTFMASPPSVHNRCYARVKCYEIVDPQANRTTLMCHKDKEAMLLMCVCYRQSYYFDHTCADAMHIAKSEQEAGRIHCLFLPKDSYRCEDQVVRDWPGWVAYLIGLLLVCTFSCLICCVTPRMERRFAHRRQNIDGDLELPTLH